MRRAGGIRRSILIERKGKARTGLGTVEGTSWSPIAKCLARVTWGDSAERRENGRETAKQTATFRCLSTAAMRAVRGGDRLTCRDVAYDIDGVVHLDTSPPECEITAHAELVQ